MSLHGLAAHPSIRSPLVPVTLTGAWRNINDPEELAALNREMAEAGEEP